MIEWLLRQRLVRFTAVGGTATLVQFLLLTLLVERLSVNPVLASAASFAISAGCNYWLNYRFTFASRASHWRTLPKFMLVALIGLGINTASFALLLLAFHYLIAQCLATLITLISNFTLHQYWIYREKS
ncbi:GtrA family protein [Microbulbifer thermotolerans]|uniref:GtrA family protein n=1 Tax=Microbulbifer thermotolerans TaxID=252514 RepID=UPI00224AD87E|nr:GtrA family protein [Microbulbifer thermotolerans]MCX2843000.1 GtrA family protein [Microbulbifer thermotolerans]